MYIWKGPGPSCSRDTGRVSFTIHFGEVFLSMCKTLQIWGEVGMIKRCWSVHIRKKSKAVQKERALCTVMVNIAELVITKKFCN